MTKKIYILIHLILKFFSYIFLLPLIIAGFLGVIALLLVGWCFVALSSVITLSCALTIVFGFLLLFFNLSNGLGAIFLSFSSIFLSTCLFSFFFKISAEFFSAYIIFHQEISKLLKIMKEKVLTHEITKK